MLSALLFVNIYFSLYILEVVQALFMIYENKIEKLE